MHVPSTSKLTVIALFCGNLNAGTIMTISKDRVKPSPMPDSWKLKEIFATGIVLGTYLAIMTVIFFWAMRETDFFSVSILDPLFLRLELLLVTDAATLSTS